MNRIRTRTGRTPARAAFVVALSALFAALATVPDVHAGAPGARSDARAAPPQPPKSPRVRADESFRLQRYAEAYGRYAALADEGDAVSAGMALVLVANGPALFGAHWSATPGQLERWRALTLRDVEQRAPLLSVHDRGE